MSIPFLRPLAMLACLLCTGPFSSGAEGRDAGAGAADEIVVTARRADAQAPRASPVTVRDRTDIERLQPDSVFDLVRDIPGVSINGGPRSTGMSFNIRGFSDNEDILVEVDGIPRSFEKYRFGSGIFIEPELLQRLSVERSPSLARGSGALGGTVSATTRDPGDLLADDRNLGGFIKSGYSTNNDERLLAASVAGRVGEFGLLGSWTIRNSNDQRLPDGSRLDNSESDGSGGLAKLVWELADATQLRLSLTRFTSRSLQPYDATGGQPGFFGTVQRDIDDRTLAATLSHTGEGGRWGVDATVGQVDTLMNDLLPPGDTPFSNQLTGEVSDRLDYRTRVARADFRWQSPAGRAGWGLWVGAQFIGGERSISRVTANVALNDRLYPGGFNAAQPPGGRRTVAAYVQPEVTFGPVMLRTGLRWDHYRIDALDGTRALLEDLDEPTRISFSRLTPGVSGEVTLWPDRLRWFYSYSEAFRPPLIDEYFTRGAFSRCIRPFLGALAPASGICGGLYVPEESRNRETGLILSWSGFRARAAWFQTTVTNVLESITVVEPGVVAQPGREERSGIEVEVSWESTHVFGRASYAALEGSFWRPNGSGPLFDLPGDTLTGQFGLRTGGGLLEAGYRIEQVADRRAIVGSTPGLQPLVGTQPGYRLHGAFATLRPSARLELRLSAENLGNERYLLNNGFGGAPGAQAPGRDLRLTMLVSL
jgi:hemoglobin/transferrin/lactoferrin receptor protein